jgi:undecaprenyl-diphosphatase
MTILQSIIFGLVEGLTEFIPVSSTGHMLLVQRLLAIQPTQSMFTYLVLIQLGAIAALLVYFRRDFWRLIKSFFARPFSSGDNRMAWFILLATVPALLAGVVLRDAVQVLFVNPLLEAAIRFLTAATVLSLAEWIGHRNRALDSMRWIDSLIIGFFQVLAVFPGASRSGASIAGGMLRNFDRASATRFAFLMSAPVMVAAGVYESFGAVRDGSLGVLLPVLPLGLLVSVVVGWFSIRWLLQYVAGHRLYAFAGYCAILGIVCLCLLQF